MSGQGVRSLRLEDVEVDMKRQPKPAHVEQALRMVRDLRTFAAEGVAVPRWTVKHGEGPNRDAVVITHFDSGLRNLLEWKALELADPFCIDVTEPAKGYLVIYVIDGREEYLRNQEMIRAGGSMLVNDSEGLRFEYADDFAKPLLVGGEDPYL